ncbi:hypothetical protein Tco_1166636 [Tanacetum coccineum]
MIKIGDEFVKILQDNAFNGIDGRDVIDHIVNVLEILEWIKIPDVDKDHFRLHIFPILLNGRAKEWWDNEINVPIEYDVNNADEVCKSEEFKVIRYSIGPDEEFITISPSKYDTWEKTYGFISCIYHDLFNKKFRGWLYVFPDIQYGVSNLYGYADLAVKKLTIWYTLKKTCAELVRAF